MFAVMIHVIYDVDRKKWVYALLRLLRRNKVQNMIKKNNLKIEKLRCLGRIKPINGVNKKKIRKKRRRRKCL